MTIECYYGSCKYHSNHFGDEGPFCDETECRVTSSELKIFGDERFQYILGRANSPKTNSCIGIPYG